MLNFYNDKVDGVIILNLNLDFNLARIVIANVLFPLINLI